MTGPVVRISAVVFLSLSFAGFARAEERAKELYTLCISCHMPDTLGNQDVGAPAIAGLPEWYIKAQLDKFHNGVRGAQAKDIRGMRMRPIGRTLDDGDRQLVAAYVAGLKRPLTPDTVKGSLVKGEARFQVCTACHGQKAEGNQQLGAPPTAGMSDWYMLTQLHNFKNGIRGYDPAVDPMGASMAGIAATLSDEDMVNVVSYINTLKPVK